MTGVLMKVLTIRMLAGLLAALIALPAMAEVKVAAVKDLTELASESRDKSVPILLMFSAPDCGYCARLERDYLKPMIMSGEYDKKILIRKVQIGAGDEVVGFDGQQTRVDALAEQYKVFVTPTVVFLGPDGRQLADKLVGYNTPDFYGSYLDSAIDRSLKRFRATAVAANP
jgi:thioredoxin-related protein